MSTKLASSLKRSTRAHRLNITAVSLIVFTLLAFNVISAILATGTAYALQPTHSASTSSKVSVNVSDIIAIRIMNLDGTTELDNLTLDLLPTPKGAFTSNSLSVETSTTNTTGYKLYIGAIGEDSSGVVTNALVNITDNSMDTGSSSSTNNTSSTSSNLDSGSSSSSSTSSTAGSGSSNGSSSASSSSSNTNSSSSIIPALSSSNVTEADYSKDNSPYKNSWSFSTNATTKTDGTATYNPVPALSTNSTNYNSVNTTNAGTDGSSSNGSYDPSSTAAIVRDNTTTAVEQELTPVTIGVNASSSLNAGTYTNTLEFTAVANPVPVDFSLSFNANTDGSGGSDGTVTGLPEGLTATAIASSYTFILPDTVPTREGYTFYGWNTKADSTGDTYLEGEEVELIVDDPDPYSANLTLYAVWATPTTAFFKIANMQQMTNTICANATQPSNTAANEDTTGAYIGNTNYVPTRTLKDTRDGNTYTIRKLADGNCWMTENLKLKLETGKEIVASTNTGQEFPYTPQGTGGNNAAEAMNSNTKTPADNGNYYYSWYAATAGTGSKDQTSGDAVGSICPKGWRLPPSYSISMTKSYGALTNAYGITIDGARIYGDYTAKMETFPLNFSRSGRYFGGDFGVTNDGYYWSSTAYSASLAYGLDYYSGSVNPQYNDTKYLGHSLRCVQADNIYSSANFFNISAMQEMNSTVCGTATTPANTAASPDRTGAYASNTSYVPERRLVDLRDGSVYTVRKLADSNCWMTENLKLDLEVGKPVTIASATDSSTSTWIPEANTGGANNTVPMNSNTVKNSDNGLWYYNWFAATGNSGTTSMGKDEDAPYSICPQNWRLPPNYSISTAKSYGALTNAYGITTNGQIVFDDYVTKMEAFPINFARSGRYNGGGLDDTTNGYYWSSTANSVGIAYGLTYSSGSVFPQLNDYKYRGYSVRCITQ